MRYDVGAAAALAELVNCPGNQLLASTTLPEQQHRHVESGHPTDLFLQALNNETVSQNRVERVLDVSRWVKHGLDCQTHPAHGMH
jgi:hypothetical protein